MAPFRGFPVSIKCPHICPFPCKFILVPVDIRYRLNNEIICDHNRAKVVSSLGHDTIRADVRYGVSDDEALELFYDSNLNQQSFSDWSYLQEFDAVKYIDTLIRQSSRQGERNDFKKNGY